VVVDSLEVGLEYRVAVEVIGFTLEGHTVLLFPCLEVIQRLWEVRIEEK